MKKKKNEAHHRIETESGLYISWKVNRHDGSLVDSVRINAREHTLEQIFDLFEILSTEFPFIKTDSELPF